MQITGDEWYELGERLLAMHGHIFTPSEGFAVSDFLAVAKRDVEVFVEEINEE